MNEMTYNMLHVYSTMKNTVYNSQRYCWFFLVRIVVLTFIAPTLFPGTFFLDQEAHILAKCIAEI